MLIFYLFILSSAAWTGYSQHGSTLDGFCTVIEEKDSLETQIVSFLDVETFVGKCPGYYFKRCLQSRHILKTRVHYDIVKKSHPVRKCCDMYQEFDGECVPTCMPSCGANSKCTGVNQCTCHDGFEEDVFARCLPKCLGCKHGECLSPQVCQCNAGYDWDESALECKPRCSNCLNGTCTAPEICTCNRGFIKHHSLDLCIPHCESCVFGKCVGPNTCDCDPNYISKNNTCEPICEIECLNGRCVEPNTCECHENFVVHNESRPNECHCGKYCVQIDDKCHCLDGRQRVKDFRRLYGDGVGNCTESNCENGFCATSDDCECLDGFMKNENDTCAPLNDTCIDETIEDCAGLNATTPEPSRMLCGCINGICSHENKCFCIGGYKMSNTTADKCIPHCSTDCLNGYCSEPELCSCDPGYRVGFNESDWNICYPVCNDDLENDGCVNATCVAPNKCECLHGFEPSPDANFTCIPSTIDSNSLQREDSSTGTWVWIGLLVLIVILCSASFFGFTLYKKRGQIYQYQDQYSTEPIANDPNEDL